MKKLLPFVIVIVLLLGIVIAVPFLIQPERYRGAITNDLVRRLGHPVTIGKLEAGIFPPRLHLQQLTVSSKDDQQPILQAEKVSIAPAIGALCSFRTSPRIAELVSWAATMAGTASATSATPKRR